MTARRPLFIVNPAAGGGRARRLVAPVRDAARSRDPRADVVCTDHAGHAIELARAAAEAGFNPVVGVGGDGTLHEIANGLLQAARPAALGAVPCGSGNDFVRSLRLPIDAREALDLAWSGVERTIDLAACGGRVFLNAGGAGFDARVARSARSAPGWMRIGTLPYVAAVLVEIAANTAHAIQIRLDERVLDRQVLMVSVANLPYYGGGMKICPDAAADDGLLDVCVVSALSRREILALLPKVFSGAHRGHPRVEFHRARRVRIDGLSSEVQLDGELVQAQPVEFESVPGALRVIVRPS